MKTLTPSALKLRSDANPVAAGILAGLFGMLASVPISIRQKDWKVWALPALAGAFLFMVSTAQNNAFERRFYSLLALCGQGGLCAALVSQNKRDARETLATK